MHSRASQCAASLRRFPRDDRHSQSEILISTALSLISQTARFVEEKAKEDPSLGVLSLAILAKTKTDPDAEVSLFRLWGPRLGPADVTEESASSAQRLCNVGAQGQIQRENGDTTDPEGHIPLTTVQDLPGIHSSSETAEVRLDTHALSSPSQIFEIEDRISALCLSLLSDASGMTTHPSCHRSKSLWHIPAPVLRTALRQMMKEYKNRNGSAAKDAKYSSLIPFELRDRQVSFSSLSLMRVDSGYHVSGSPVTTTLTVKKPDRNKKDVHFGMLAALLQIDPDGICSQELHAMAAHGLGPNGCTLKPGFSCGGPKLCSESRVRPLSRFLNDSNEVVGSGEVYPSISFFQGNLLPPNMLMIRFSSCESENALEGGGKFCAWRSDLVSRSELLDAYGICVGTAIFATHAIHEERRKLQLPLSDFDMSQAVVVCNAKILTHHATDRYCFLEWYSFGAQSWREVYDPCILNSTAPRTLGEFGKFPCGFWHKKYLKDVPPRISS